MRYAFHWAVLAACAGAASAQPLTYAAVRPEAEPFSETVHGERVNDPYRWMEQANRSADVQAFIRTAGEHGRARLGALPGRSALRARVEAGMQAGVRYGAVQQVGALTFYQRTDPGAQRPKLVYRDAGGTERVLYDPDAGTRGAVNNYSVSPDGRTVAIHTAGGGAEVGPRSGLSTWPAGGRAPNSWSRSGASSRWTGWTARPSAIPA